MLFRSEVGRGLCLLSSEELRPLLGLSGHELRERLGASGLVVVHRNQLVLAPGIRSSPSASAAAEGGSASPGR